MVHVFWLMVTLARKLQVRHTVILFAITNAAIEPFLQLPAQLQLVLTANDVYSKRWENRTIQPAYACDSLQMLESIYRHDTGRDDTSSHLEHELKLQHKIEPYMCNGCGEWGCRSGYECSTCNFHLHKDCAMPFPTIIQPFFPGLCFRFRESSTRPSYCDACGRDIKGLSTTALKKDGTCTQPVRHSLKHWWSKTAAGTPDQAHQKAFFKICICAKLPRTVEGKLKLELCCHKVSTICYKCGKKKYMHKGRNSWSYVSPCGEYHSYMWLA